MTMIEQHELALAILAWVGILSLPATYVALFVAVVLMDRREDLAIAAATGTAKTPKAVECEAPQSGAESASPNSPMNTPHP
jgi:hypothetical protein